MEKYERPKSSLASRSRRRRFEPLDMNKSSSSLNASTSSLRSTAAGGEKTSTRKDDAAVQVQVGRRTTTTTTVRFAAHSSSKSSSSSLASSSTTKTTSSLVSGRHGPQEQAVARPATAIGPRRPGSSAGRSAQAGPTKAVRRSWGLTTTGPVEERSDRSAATKMQQVRSSSAPRRILPPDDEKEKPSPKRGSKIMTGASRTMKNSNSEPHLKPADKAVAGSNSPTPETAVAKKTSCGPKSAPGSNVVTLNNDDTMMMVNKQVSPASSSSRVTVVMIGEAWESLPSDVQALGLEVMRYRDNAEAAAVEILQEASAAEVLLRCLRAFAELTSAAAEQPPQRTVDEFLPLHAALTRTSTATAATAERGRRRPAAAEWLRAAVATDLAPFALYYSASTRQPATSRAASSSPVSSPQSSSSPVAAATAGAEEEDRTWVDAARRVLGETMRAWFHGHVERLLDGDVAGTLGQLRRVSDWLDAVDGLAGSESSSEAVERVRRKIYGYLLDHVESAVVALNGAGAGGAAPAVRRK